MTADIHVQAHTKHARRTSSPKSHELKMTHMDAYHARRILALISSPPCLCMINWRIVPGLARRRTITPQP